MIKINSFKLILSVIAGVILTFTLSFNTLSVAFQRGETVIRSESDLSKLEEMSNGDYVSITGTPNFLYKVKEGASNYYFPLKEYGFNILIRSDRDFSNVGKIEFVGKITKLRNIDDHDELIEVLNTPIDLSKIENISFTEEQLEYIESQATGDFNEETFLLTFSTRNTLSTEIIISELFFIFVLATLGISSIIGGFRYEKVRRPTIPN